MHLWCLVLRRCRLSSHYPRATDLGVWVEVWDHKPRTQASKPVALFFQQVAAGLQRRTGMILAAPGQSNVGVTRCVTQFKEAFAIGSRATHSRAFEKALEVLPVCSGSCALRFWVEPQGREGLEFRSSIPLSIELFPVSLVSPEPSALLSGDEGVGVTHVSSGKGRDRLLPQGRAAAPAIRQGRRMQGHPSTPVSETLRARCSQGLRAPLP